MRALVLAVLAACSVSSTREVAGRSDGPSPCRHDPAACSDHDRAGGLSGASQATIDAYAPPAWTQPRTNPSATQRPITPLLCPDPELANPASDEL